MHYSVIFNPQATLGTLLYDVLSFRKKKKLVLTLLTPLKKNSLNPLSTPSQSRGAFWRTRSVQQKKWVWQNASLLGGPNH